jgi:hypothetical protein
MFSNLEVSVIFPFNKSLCPTSPSLPWVAWASLPHLHRYYARLRLPPVLLGVLPKVSLVHRYLARSLSSCPFFKLGGVRMLCTPAWPAWSTGTPFPVLLIRRQLDLPGSQVTPLDRMPRSPTPVVTNVLAVAPVGLLPSAPLTASALLSTTIQISRLYHAACFLAPPGFGLPLLGLPARFTTSLLARLWLGGAYTHWVTLTNFYRQHLFPIVLGFPGATCGLLYCLSFHWPKTAF